MSDKLAINGGKPVFAENELNSIRPAWPPLYPETEEKLIEVYRSRKWSNVKKYETLLTKEFAEFQGSKYSIWMANGTVTLECALLALGVGPGDEVIVPGISWVATAQAPLYVGATPVFVDVDPDTMCIDPAKIEEAITERTKAIIPVHIYSSVADMDKINAIAKKHNLFVIEDCAHCHGTKQHGVGTGALGDIGSFSFQLSKIMTGGEGGCCTTNNEKYADLLFRLSHITNSMLFPKEKPPVGLMCHQYRFTDFQAAIIYDQLQHQSELRAKRQKNAALMQELIKDTPGVKMQASSYEDDFRDYYFIAFLLQREYIRPGVDRKEIYAALLAEGFQLHEAWGAPMYDMVAWNMPANLFVKHDTTNCDEIMYKRLMCTDNTLFLTDEKTITRCAEALTKVINAFSK